MSEELMTKVQDLVDSMINAAVAGHGGFVQLGDVKDKKVYLRMGGGCQGCGAHRPKGLPRRCGRGAQPGPVKRH